MRSPIVYLPVEFQSREFDGKTLLAATLAERGYPVVIGQQNMLLANLDRLPAGVVLFKSFNKLYHPRMHEARAAGHRVVALEEELLAQVEEKAVASLCAPGIFDAVDLILSHGQFEHDILKRLSGGRARTEIAGNVRIELLKPALRPFFRSEVDAIRQRHGDFVLVNTNFSVLNSVWGSLERVTEIQIAAGFVRPEDPATVRYWNDYIAFEKANRAAMDAAVRELARRRPQQKIIVRPHPGEDLARWNGVFAGCPGVSIVREGSHVPWTLASRVLLHTSCTTGFEAHVAGKAALSLVPQPGPIGASLFSNMVNPVFRDPGELVRAAEDVLDGGAPGAAPPAQAPPQHYLWNHGVNDARGRIADLLTEDLPPPAAIALPALQEVPRDEKMMGKFPVSLAQCVDGFRRMAQAAELCEAPGVRAVGDGLFLVTPARSGDAVSISPPKMDHAQLRAAIEGACQAGSFQKAYEVFKENFGEAHRHADLCFLTGVALFELGRHALALQYFQNAALAAGGAVDWNVSAWLARTHRALGELEIARRYAEQAYRQVPAQHEFFELYRELAQRTGQKAPEHWMVIGCSHVRYFRYMQVNQPKFFDGAVHLDCHEFGGATAYGLGNLSSQSGALKATRQLKARIAQADRVIVQFGEVDCRRAAWKAAAVSGRPVEEMVGESVAQLESYVRAEILPHNKRVLLLGAKPQIIGDEDFYRNSLVDERTIFKPLAERERVTADFNARLRQAAERLRVDYADIDHVLADEKSRRKYFKKVYWDSYTTDTHGNVDYIAGLYFQRLQPFVGRSIQKR